MLTATSLLLSLAILPQQGTLVFASGPRADQLAVQAVDESNPLATPVVVLGDAEFLPAELTARTTADAWRHDRPRLLVDHGVARVVLPGGGALHKYRRAGKTVFGWLLVRPDGRPLVLLERTGTGPGSLGDPFLPYLGVSRDGGFAGMATATEVLLVRLDGGTFASTGTPARRAMATPVLHAEDQSFVLGPSAFFFQTGERRVFRCATSDGAVPEELVLPASATRLDEEMAISDDGSTIAFLAGSDRALLILYAAGVAGPPRPLTAPGHYEEPGYLPAMTTGPYLLLSPDGSRVAYTESQNREEVFVVPASLTTPPRHVTADALFDPYVDTGVFFIFVGQVLAIGIGADANAVDYYAVRETNGVVSVQNLTLTSGLSAPPFGGNATLDLGAVRSVPGGLLLLENRTPAGIELIQLDPATGARTLLLGALAGTPRAMPASPGAFPDLLGIGGGVSTLLTPGAAGYRTTLQLPAAFPLRASVPRAGAGWRYLAVEAAPGLEVDLLANLPASVFLLGSGTPTDTFAWTPAGGAVQARPTTGGVSADWYSATGLNLRLPVSGAELRLLNAAAR